MSKHHNPVNPKTPRPSELLGKQTPPKVEPEAKAVETPKAEVPKEANTLEEMVANLPQDLREKALAEINKLRQEASRTQQAKAWVGFDTALKDEATGLPKFIGDLATKHGVSLANRKITITYPDGKFSYTNAPKGSKGNGGGNGRSGFPAGWGKAVLIKDGKVVQTESSASKLADTLGLQIEGMRNMVDVYENPHAKDTKAELPKIYSVDAVKGDHFRVTIKG